MSTRLDSRFSSWIFIFQLNKTSVFNFSVDTKFLITKVSSFFGQISFFWFQLYHKERKRIRAYWKLWFLKWITISQQSYFKTFAYSILTKNTKVFKKQKNIARIKFFVKPLEQINWLYITLHGLIRLEIIIKEHLYF